ncbi:MAG: DUF1934 domain-containing protein [Culicoidibacterales bacterium]
MEEVWIDFMSQTKLNGELLTHSFTSRGQLQSDGESLILSFTEPGVEGLEGTIQARIIATPQKVVMTRTGVIQMQQEFTLSGLAEGTYVVPYGRLKTKAQTHELDYRWDEQDQQGHFTVRYDFYIETEFSGEFTLELMIRTIN